MIQRKTKNIIEGILWFMLFITVLLTAHVITTSVPEHNTVDIQPTLVCYSAFDVYEVHDYEYAEDNLSLTTSYGRVYHSDECREK